MSKAAQDVIRVHQDATLEELVDVVASCLPGVSGLLFRETAEKCLGKANPFAEVLDVARAWGIACVPGPRKHE